MSEVRRDSVGSGIFWRRLEFPAAVTPKYVRVAAVGGEGVEDLSSD
jgi:hypothetical protein